MRFKKGSSAAKKYMAKLRRLRDKHGKKKKSITHSKKKRVRRLFKKVRRHVRRFLKHPIKTIRRRIRRARTRKFITTKRFPIAELGSLGLIFGAGIGKLGLRISPTNQPTNPSLPATNPPPTQSKNPPPVIQNPSLIYMVSASFTKTLSDGSQVINLSGANFTPNSSVVIQAYDNLDQTDNQQFNSATDGNGSFFINIGYTPDPFDHIINYLVIDAATGNFSQTVSVKLPASQNQTIGIKSTTQPNQPLPVTINPQVSWNATTQQIIGTGFLPNSSISYDYGASNGVSSGSQPFNQYAGNSDNTGSFNLNWKNPQTGLRWTMHFIDGNGNKAQITFNT